MRIAAAEIVLGRTIIDVAQHGWPPVLVTAAAIALGFVAAGFGLLSPDRRLAR